MRPSALLVMSVISEVKGITLAGKAVLSNKTRIAAVADVIGLARTVFDRCRMIEASSKKPNNEKPN
jgi:hypothetical protein